MLIWGRRTRLSVIGAGTFHCPLCQADVGYRHVRPRAWFTLFFLPVLPLGWHTACVECDGCRASFDESVLLSPTTAQLNHQLGLAARAAYAKLAAFAGSSMVASLAAEQVRLFLADDGYAVPTLLADAAVFGSLELDPYLAEVAWHLTPQGREAFVHDLVATAAADPCLHLAADGAVHAVITEAASALQLTPTHLQGVLSAVAGKRRAA